MNPSKSCHCKEEKIDTCRPGKIAQPYPTSGILADNLNLSLKLVRKKLTSGQNEADFYVYILSTLKIERGIIQQKGSGPNFQGGIISLCTCKHWMRTWSEIVGPDPLWVAGLTGKNVVGDGRSYLFYLMYVESKYTNHLEAWQALKPEVRQSKNASNSVFGDLYKPHEDLKSSNGYNPQKYYPPLNDHPHFSYDPDNIPYWHYDIHPKYYDNEGKLKPYVLLFGDPKRCFIWSRPEIRWKDDPGFTQGQRVLSQDEFLGNLW